MKEEIHSDDRALSKQEKLFKSLRASQKENQILLAFSNEVTIIRNKLELLPFLRNKFKQYSFYSDIVISLVNEDGITATERGIERKFSSCPLRIDHSSWRLSAFSFSEYCAAINCDETRMRSIDHRKFMTAFLVG